METQKTMQSFPASQNTPFQAKHSNGLSFEFLSQGNNLMEHLIDMDVRIINGRILPSSPEDVDDWLKKAHKKKFSMFEATDSDLVKAEKEAITKKYKGLVWTKEAQTFSNVRFEQIKDADGKIVAVDIYLEKWESRVQLALDDTNSCCRHMEGFDHKTGVQIESVPVGRFTRDDLEVLANKKQLFLKKYVPLRQQFDDERGKPLFGLVLDSNTEAYKNNKPALEDLPDASKNLHDASKDSPNAPKDSPDAPKNSPDAPKDSPDAPKDSPDASKEASSGKVSLNSWLL